MYLGLPLTAVMAIIIIVYFLINRLGITIKFIPLLICGIMGLFLGLVLPKFLVPQLSMVGTILLVLFFMFVLSVILALIFGKEGYAERPGNVRPGDFKADDAMAVLPLAADAAGRLPAAKRPAPDIAAAVSFKDAGGEERPEPEDDYLTNDGFEPALLNAPSFNIFRYVEPAIEKIAARVFPANGKIRPSGYIKSFREDSAASADEYNMVCGANASDKDFAGYADDYKGSWLLCAGEKIMAVLSEWKLATPAGREIDGTNAQEANPAVGDKPGAMIAAACLPADGPSRDLPTSEHPVAKEGVPVYAGYFAEIPSWASDLPMSEHLAAKEGSPIYAGHFADIPSWAADDLSAAGGHESGAVVCGGNSEFADCLDGQRDGADIPELCRFAGCPDRQENYAAITEEMTAGHVIAPICPLLVADGMEKEFPAHETRVATNDGQGFAPDERENKAARETRAEPPVEAYPAQGGQGNPPATEIYGNVLPFGRPCLAQEESRHIYGRETFPNAAPSREDELFGRLQCAYTPKHCADEDLPYKRLGDEAMAGMEKHREQPPAVQVPKSDSIDDLLDFAFEQKEQGSWNNALFALQMAHAMYPQNEFALLIIVETANIYKQMGNYDLAIAELQKGLEKIAAENVRHDFILNIGCLRIIKNILKTNGIALLPYNEIPDKVKDEIEKEYLEWKSLSQQ